jgi:4'-phosphopantetheinyl transferase
VVEVHWVSIDVDADRLSELDALLSGEERERAARFRFERDRNHFIACRGMLRELLGVDARRSFTYNAYGKPRLENSEVRFNVSHSRGMAMIAVTRGREVGCDIEWIDPTFADHAIAERFFSREEAAMLRGLSEEERRTEFFRCWTRKEAFIKALGVGMSMGLDRVGGDQPGWVFRDVDAPEGYAAAVVLQKTEFVKVGRAASAGLLSGLKGALRAAAAE